MAGRLLGSITIDADDRREIARLIGEGVGRGVVRRADASLAKIEGAA